MTPEDINKLFICLGAIIGLQFATVVIIFQEILKKGKKP